MSLISKEEEIQEELTAVYTLLLNKKDKIQNELSYYSSDFKRREKLPFDHSWAAGCLHCKLVELDMYCQIIEIIDDFKDLYGNFPEYQEMLHTLNQTMLEFAEDEKYELAAITKLWVDQIKIATLESTQQ